MRISELRRTNEWAWEVPRTGAMRVPGRIYADKRLIEDMEDTVLTQVKNVASLPGIVTASFAMPDAHSGYGFPIGGVAAFDPDTGVVSAGGVGFDIACGVRTLVTNLSADDLAGRLPALADALFSRIPAGVGSTGAVRLTARELDAMLAGGAVWAVSRGFGEKADLERIEERGRMDGARPEMVSEAAKARQKDQMGTLGAGNHYLEVQAVDAIFNDTAARLYGLGPEQVTVAIHCGSRGLGHQIGTDYLKRMHDHAAKTGVSFPDRELAYAPIASDLGQSYLGAMRSGINAALANRQILTHMVREVFAEMFPGSRLALLYDVSHNTCKAETHHVDGALRRLFVHRKGATRSLGPGHPDLPPALAAAGQPVLVGGSMGTASFILSGTAAAETRAFASACHGAGRAMSRKQAAKHFKSRTVLEDLDGMGVAVRAHDFRGLSEEAPGAYKNIEAVADAACRAELATKTARVRPLACIKG
ncbi:RtcB family protein [Desulfolutivibrio sp.]|uniref:RtcB family protein n=1 Tax=Desulfolutivibrio sp. TaxID=2773296 RepID=UPI002F9675DB